MSLKKASFVKKWKKGNTKIISKQKAIASVGSNGNAFAINASDIAVVRVRP